jgi:hypothetical protein
MAAQATNPIDTPEAFDTFTLDGRKAPGLATLQGGGNRKDKIEQQQAPDGTGAFTLVKGAEMSAPTYLIEVWLAEHFKALGPWLDMLNAGRRRRPPRVYKYADQRTAHNGISAVVVEDIGPLAKIGPRKWGIAVAFQEYKKRRPYGGAPKQDPAFLKDLRDKVTRQNEVVAAKAAQLKSASEDGAIVAKNPFPDLLKQ